MSSSFMNAAFNFILTLQGRDVTLERGATSVTVKMAPSNYFRNLSGPEEVVIGGREFVVSKEALDGQSYGTPRRGDLIIDSDMGPNAIVEVREMIVLGKLVGYRMRTG